MNAKPLKITLREATSTYDYTQAAGLFRDYARELPIDLDFQDFEHELNTIAKMYAPPRGTLLFAVNDGNDILGCVAIRPFKDDICELKRMYVKPSGRGLGIGTSLLKEAIRKSRELGYAVIRLDTLSTMKKAIQLYERSGFYEIPPYRFNPVPGAKYYEKTLKT
ncbi:MAG: GNAT family N-acetyltransferase [Bacteroidota bacterium]